jgi:holliday junction DNA helicase RuvB
MGPSDDVHDLTPDDWDQFLGQRRLKAELEIRIQAAKEQQRPLGHILLVTEAGGGKTTLAKLIAERLGDDFMSVICPISPKALAQTVRSFDGILLLDEIHAMRTAQEALLPLIRDRYLQLASGSRLENPWITIIGATTEPGRIIKPLWDRFLASGGVPAFDPYEPEELAQVAFNMGRKLGLELDAPTCAIYGTASIGIPRHVEQYVLAHRDLMVANHGVEPTPEETLAMLRTSADGLTAYHQKYLESLDALGGTKGVKIIAALMRVPEAVVIDTEYLLIKQGYIAYTDAGRQLTVKGHTFLRGDSTRRRLG